MKMASGGNNRRVIHLSAPKRCSDKAGHLCNPNRHDLNNLVALVAEIKSLRLSSILYRFMFQADNAVGRTVAASLEATNSQLTATLTKQAFERALFPCIADLTGGGEYENVSSTAIAYSQYIYRNYIDEFGTDNTFGFSPPVWNQAGLNNRGTNYQGVLPSELEFNIYGSDGSPGAARPSTHDQITTLSADLKAMGVSVPWVITETWYNDPFSADQLAQAIKFTRQTVTAVYRRRDTPDLTVVIPPVDITPHQVLDAPATEVPEPSTVTIKAVALLGIAITIPRQVRRRSGVTPKHKKSKCLTAVPSVSR